MTKPLTALLLVLAPLLAVARLGGRTARQAGRWFEEADEVWEPFLTDDEEERALARRRTHLRAA